MKPDLGDKGEEKRSGNPPQTKSKENLNVEGVEGGSSSVAMQNGNFVLNGGSLHVTHNSNDNGDLESVDDQTGNEIEEVMSPMDIVSNGTLEPNPLNGDDLPHDPIEEPLSNGGSSMSAVEEYLGVPSELEEDYEPPPEAICMKEFHRRLEFEYAPELMFYMGELLDQVVRGEYDQCEHQTEFSPCSVTPQFLESLDRESYTQMLDGSELEPHKLNVIWQKENVSVVKKKTEEFKMACDRGEPMHRLPRNPVVLLSRPDPLRVYENGENSQKENESSPNEHSARESLRDEGETNCINEMDLSMEVMEVEIPLNENEAGEKNDQDEEVAGSSKNLQDNKEKEQSDSDDDRPAIFIRNFAEISEDQSDDDDIVVLDPTPKKKRCEDEEVPTTIDANAGLKTYQRKSAPPPRKRIQDLVTFDDSLATLDMTSEGLIDVFITDHTNKKQETRDLMRQGTFALRKALIERKRMREIRASTMQAPITMTPSQPSPRIATPIQGLRPRGSTPIQLQSQGQAAYPRVPMPGLAPLNILAPTGNTGGLPVSVAQFQQGTFTQVSSASALPRVNAPVINQNNQSSNHPGIQQLGSQLYFDTTKGLLYTVPNLNQGVSQQQTASQMNNQQHINPPNSVRLQNGMNVCFNQRQQMVLGTSPMGQQIITLPPGLQIQPQLQPPPPPVVQRPQPPPPPVRIRQPVIPPPRQVLVPRHPGILPRQQYPGQNSVRPQQMVNQVRLQRPPVQPINIQQAISQMQFTGRLAPQPELRMPVPPPAAIPQVVQNASRSQPIPQTNKPVPINSTQNPNSVANAQQPSKSAPNPITSKATAETTITAGTQQPVPGTVEDLDAEPQNKTFPSLVVLMKTSLRIKPSKTMSIKARVDLDAQVKAVLVHSPSSFAEWMMRRGVLKLEHKCVCAHHQPLKLGKYSDDSRQPFSGGYVWTADCCPDKQISIFQGSIFEGSKYPPGTVLKLIYHWSVQTPAANTMNWVKISSLYLKNFFTLLRGVCISWLHEHCPVLGGELKFVEIGVITLGSSAETSRGVKSVNVEILGVFDPATKIVRMKVINSLQGLSKEKGNMGSNEQGARAFQILWPLTHWVDKRSTLLVDGIIDKTLFFELGFKNIQQCGENASQNAPTNSNVMNYLRQVVPKMFASTLSVLSKSIVQQFLDELSWREMYGLTVSQNFENILDHIGGMTKWNLNGGLIPRLNKVTQNPFADWSFTKQARRSPLNTIPVTLRNEAGIKECIQYILKDEHNIIQAPIANIPPPLPIQFPTSQPQKPPPPKQQPLQKPQAPPQAPLPVSTGEKRKASDSLSASRQSRIMYYQKSPKQLSLEKYYYGLSIIRCTKPWASTPFNSSIKCPLCVKTFSSSREIIRHIAAHVGNLPKTSENWLCTFCLKSVTSTIEHRKEVHELTECLYACHFCQLPFSNEMDLTMHMWELHVEAEAPFVCDICDYATSFHCDVIDHFNERHGETCFVMCPYCLKVLSAKSVAFLKTIVVHLQSHQLKRTKKCPKCVLTFGNDIDLRNHMAAHIGKANIGNAWLRTTRNFPISIAMATPPSVKPVAPFGLPEPSTANKPKKRKLNPEKKKVPETHSTLNTPISVPLPTDPNKKFAGFTYKVTVPVPAVGRRRAICWECNVDIATPNHYIGRISCTKCRFTTSCRQAMDIHHDTNHDPDKKSRKPILPTNKETLLNDPLVCKCGYMSKSAFKLAGHLADCEKYTVYPQNRIQLHTTSGTSSSEAPPSLPLQPGSSQNKLSEKSGEIEKFLSYSMNTSLEALSLPPVLSPSAPMPDSPFGEIPGFEDNVNSLLQDLM